MIPKRVIVVGAGGIGSHFIPVAARLLAYGGFNGDFAVMDGDTYEEKNRARQLFPQRMIGKNKATAQVESVFDLGIGTTAYEGYVENADQFAGIAVQGTHGWQDNDFLLVCLCVDNDATRRMVYDGLLDADLNFVVIDMANELHTGDVILCGRFGKERMYPWPPDVYPNLINPGDRPPQAYCTERAPDTPQIVTTNMMAACMGAEIMRRIMDPKDDLIVPSKVTFDMLHFKSYETLE